MENRDFDNTSSDTGILAWAQRFLPDYFTEQPADFHRELMTDLEDSKKSHLARVAPRGHAKSTCVSLAYPLWAICEQKRRNIVIVSNESTLARQFVRDIRAELETNPLIRQTYGDLFTPPEPEPEDRAPLPELPAQAREATIPSEPQAQAPGAQSEPLSPDAHPNNSLASKKPPKKRKSAKPSTKKTTKKKQPAKKKTIASHRAPIQSPDATSVSTSVQKKPRRRKTISATPKSRRPKNSESYFATITGVTVQAKGSGAAFRGVRVGPHRPDLIICDDIEKDAQVSTAEGRQKLERWLRRVVLPALAPDGRIVIIGSILHSDSLLASLADSKRWPRWDYRVYRALEAIPAPSSEPDAQATPTVDRERVCSNGHHTAQSSPAPSLRRDVTPSLLPTFNLRALWPSRWPVARLLEERERIGTLAFEQEYQANPIDDALRVFRPDRLRRTMALELEQLDRENRLANLIAIDPATGTTGGDYFALWAGGVDTQTGIIHTRELTLERIGIIEQVQRIVSACERYKPIRVGIETVAYQAALQQVLEEIGRTRNFYIPLVPIKTVANKRARIEGSACFYESGTFRLPAVLPPEVELQFFQFPKAKHDDAPDVCAMAIELARSLRTLSGPLVLFRRFNNPFNRPGGW